jgi:hypothetical protein
MARNTSDEVHIDEFLGIVSHGGFHAHIPEPVEPADRRVAAIF